MGEIQMPEANQSELLTKQLETSAAKTREQPRPVTLEVIPPTEQAKIFASILDMDVAVIVADENENLLVFNRAAERMFGAGATKARADEWSEQYGLFLSDQVTPFPAEQLPLARAIRGETVDDVELFVKHAKAPSGLWASVSGRPLKDAGGASFGGVIVCRDITGHKNEENFRAGQSRILEMIAANKPLGEILNNLVLLIEAQSPEMLCSVLLLSSDGNHIRHGAAPSLPDEYVKAIDGTPIGPKHGSCGTAMFRGKPVIVTDVLTDPLWEDYRDLAAPIGLRACWSTPIMSARGKVLGSFAMYYRQPQTPTGDEARLTDVATHIAALAVEHQTAQEKLRQTQAELAHAAQVTSMREVAVSIGQEVNQTLAAIVDNADRCLRSLDENKPDPGQLREALTKISNDGRRTVEIIARIRALAKISPPQKVSLNLAELVSQVFSLVGHEAQRKHITLQAELTDNLPSVLGDPVQLQQVLLNLVMNGMEAMSGLSDRSLELAVKIDRAENGDIVAGVTDHGTGIKPQEIDRVFKAFHTTKNASLGMGLSICRSIIEAHGGRLWAEPNIGPGTTFKFTLPAGVRAAPASPSA
jgi:PAS domain S-box-containing protein